MHQRNAVERSIHTFKHHFIDGLYSIDPLPSATVGQVAPTGYTYSQPPLQIMYQTKDVSPRTTTNSIVPPWHHLEPTSYHKKPKQRMSWAPHGLEGWYMCPAPSTIGVTPSVSTTPMPCILSTLLNSYRQRCQCQRLP
jgi:hypothetical protein